MHTENDQSCEYTEAELRSAYDEGYSACCRGEERESPDGFSEISWLDGYDDAKHDRAMYARNNPGNMSAAEAHNMGW